MSSFLFFFLLSFIPPSLDSVTQLWIQFLQWLMKRPESRIAVATHSVQGYLTYTKTHPPRTLP